MRRGMEWGIGSCGMGWGGIVRRRMEWGIVSCEMGCRVVWDGVSCRVGWCVESCGMVGIVQRRMEWGYRVVKESDCVD